MGGVGSKPGTIGVVFDQSVASPGAQISGKVLLGVSKDKMECSSLNLRFTGGEHTAVRYTTHSGSGKHRRTHRHTTRQQNLFLDADFILSNFPSGDVREGSYEFPFTLSIPPGMPSSLYCHTPGDHGGTAEVKYTVHTRLHRPGWLKWDVECSTHLTVRPLPSIHVPRHPLYGDPQRIRLNTMCCYRRGELVMSMSCPSSVLCVGETVPVHYALLNYSTVQINYIQISIIETVSWSANNRRRSNATTIASVTMQGENVEMATAQGKRDKDQIQDSRGDFTAVQQILQDQKHFVQLAISGSARTSMTGTLITVSHRLVMHVRTSFGTCNADYTYPVTIIPSAASNAPFMVTPPQEAQVAQVPANWAPTTAPLVALPVPAYAPPKMHDATEADLGPPPPYEFPSSGQYSPYNAASAPPCTGFDALQFEMNNTYNRLAALEKWLPANSATNLTPQQLYLIFNGFSDTMDQLTCARMLVNAMNGVTCEQIASAAAGSNDIVKRQVVEELAAKCVDKENHALVQDKLSPFQYMIVEKHFQ